VHFVVYDAYFFFGAAFLAAFFFGAFFLAAFFLAGAYFFAAAFLAALAGIFIYKVCVRVFKFMTPIGI
jgi:hypothetical protein